MDTIRKDYLNSLLWGCAAIVMGMATPCLAPDRSRPGLAIAIGGVFVIGGVALIVKARGWFKDLTQLMREGKRQDAWISLHPAGAGGRRSTSLLVKVYVSASAPRESLSFEVAANDNLRALLERKEREPAVLLRRAGEAGMVMIYVHEQMVLPSGDVRYVK